LTIAALNDRQSLHGQSWDYESSAFIPFVSTNEWQAIEWQAINGKMRLVGERLVGERTEGKQIAESPLLQRPLLQPGSGKSGQ
jgi:hypothetical protein